MFCLNDEGVTDVIVAFKRGAHDRIVRRWNRSISGQAIINLDIRLRPASREKNYRRRLEVRLKKEIGERLGTWISIEWAEIRRRYVMSSLSTEVRPTITVRMVG